MFCTQCGTNLLISARFCTRCGSPTHGLEAMNEEKNTLSPWWNPFHCKTEAGTKIAGIVFFIALLGWIAWVANQTNGFSRMKAAEWFVLFLAPAAVYFVPFYMVPFIKSQSKEKYFRYVLSGNVIWVFCLSAWAFIWGWGRYFSAEEFVALYLLPIFGSWLGMFMLKWSNGTDA